MTDSTSDLRPELAAELGITVVPLFVNFGEQRYRDGVDLTRERFYELLRTEHELPTTTQPTAAMFDAAFREELSVGGVVVGIFISEKLSGTINAARAAARNIGLGRIELVDSLTATAGLGMQAIHAAELARDGAEIDDVLTALHADRRAQHGYAALPDLSHAVRTGRIGKARAAIGTMLRIVPVLRLDRGEVEEEARVRTFERAQQTMIESTLRTIGDVERARIVVMHSHAPDLAVSVRERLRSRLSAEPAMLTIAEAGPTIAVHAGAGAVGIFSIAG